MDREPIRAKRLGFNISKNHDLSIDLLDIGEKPDVAVWNKVIRKRNAARTKSPKIGPLNQNPIREDTDSIIDPANTKDVEDDIILESKITDKVNIKP